VNAIEVKNLTKAYSPPLFKKDAKFTALKNVSLTIETGSIFSILGPNGAGKTTLILTLSGFIPPTQGEILINGIPIGRKTRALVGLFTAEAKGYWNLLSGYENLILFCAFQNIVGKKAKHRANELIDLFGMADYISRPVYTYSNGMKHKLLLARSMVHDPPILLLDEPMNFLDPLAARELYDFLKIRLNREMGKTLLISTHRLDEAQEISDSLGFLLEGRLIWQKDAGLFRSLPSSLLNEFLETVRE